MDKIVLFASAEEMINEWLGGSVWCELMRKKDDQKASWCWLMISNDKLMLVFVPNTATYAQLTDWLRGELDTWDPKLNAIQKLATCKIDSLTYSEANCRTWGPHNNWLGGCQRGDPRTACPLDLPVGPSPPHRTQSPQERQDETCQEAEQQATLVNSVPTSGPSFGCQDAPSHG